MTALRQSELIAPEKVFPALGLFIAFVVVLSGVAELAVIEFGGYSYVGIAMWTPAIAALLTMKMLGIPMKVLGFGWGRKRYLFLGFITPLLYALIGFGIIWSFGLAGYINPDNLEKSREWYGLGASFSDISVMLVTFVMGTTTWLWSYIGRTLGAELAWRGFLVPLLMRRFRFIGTVLITTVLWLVWHLPMILYADYNNGPDNLMLQIASFAVMLFGMSLIMTYLRLKSGSVWPAVFTHAFHNLYVVSMFYKFTLPHEGSSLYIGEFGIIIPAIVLLFGLVFWGMAVNENLTGRIVMSQQ